MLSTVGIFCGGKMGAIHNTRIRKTLDGIMLLGIVFSTFWPGILPVARAHEAWIEMPTESPTAVTPQNAPETWDHTQTFIHSSYQDTFQPETSFSNPLVNGGFEDGTSSPTGWSSDAWNTSYTAFTWDNTQAYSGTRSVKIVSTTPNDARWVQSITVQPNTDYRLSGWIKTSNVAHTQESVDAGANLSLYGTYTYSVGLFGTSDWTYVTLLFNSGSSTQFTVAARLGYWYGTTTGTAWFDELRLEVLNTPTHNIQNPGFESGVSGQPDNWWTETIQGTATFEWATSATHSGSRSVKISTSEQSIARWAQTVLVDQDSEYELAGWIKTVNVVDPPGQWWTTGAKLGIYGMDSYLAAATSGMRDSSNWTYVSIRFISGRTTKAKVTCTIGEGGSTSSGTMYCDDLTLTKIRTLNRSMISGQHIALDVYTEDYSYFNNPVQYVALLDKVYGFLADMVNGVPYNGDLITVRSDASMYYGLLSGNPITIGPGHSWPDIVNVHGIDFGVPHELGHDFDLWPQSRLYMGQMTFDGAEHWANLKVLYAYDMLGEQYPALTIESWGRTVPLRDVGQRFVEFAAQPWIDEGRTDYQNMNNDVYTGLMYMLRQQVGWEPFIKTFNEYSLSSMPTPSSDLGKVELWANTLSRYARVNLIPTFQSWGFPISKLPIFSDVSTSYWAYNLIERLYNGGITDGCGTNPFIYCPENPVTRAQMAIFLERGVHGSAYQPPAVGAGTGFNDVATSYWSAAWIKQFAADGITTGCGGGNYCPECLVTRAQMAIFLLRAKHGATYTPPVVGASTGFNDVSTSYWAAAWIKQMAAEGITGGCGNGNYCPENSVTRAQMAKFLVLTFNLP
jgi:hypothetical protein